MAAGGRRWLLRALVRIRKAHRCIKTFTPWFIAMDQSIHSGIARRFPRLLRLADQASGTVFDIVSHNAFSVISGLVAGVLLITGAVDRGVVASLAAAWFITILWVAKSSPINRLTIPSRLVLVVILGLGLAYVTEVFGSWSLKQYHLSQATPQIQTKETAKQTVSSDASVYFHCTELPLPAEQA
jgi:hypothetical protein